MKLKALLMVGLLSLVASNATAEQEVIIPHGSVEVDDSVSTEFVGMLFIGVDPLPGFLSKYCESEYLESLRIPTEKLEEAASKGDEQAWTFLSCRVYQKASELLTIMHAFERTNNVLQKMELEKQKPVGLPDPNDQVSQVPLL